VLEELAATYALPKLILEYRGMAKLKSTYTDNLPLQINEVTGRIHTSYHQAVAATGRTVIAGSEFAEHPIRTQEGRRIRQAFVAPPGHSLVAAITRNRAGIMAHLSGDASLLRAFAEDRDVHQATAAEVFGIAPNAVSADQRRSAKAINFGLMLWHVRIWIGAPIGYRPRDAQKYMDFILNAIPACAAT